MTKQPEALRLADELEKCWADAGLQLNAAAELRRLHEEVKCEERRFNDLWDQFAALDKVNQELLAALKNISLCSQNSMSSKTECGTIAIAAIAKAEGQAVRGGPALYTTINQESKHD